MMTGAAASPLSMMAGAMGGMNEGGGNYWAKGTGFGTGSTNSSWDIEKAMKQKKREEEEMVIILQVCLLFTPLLSILNLLYQIIISH